MSLQSSCFEVVTDEARLKKMKRRICKAAELHEKAMHDSAEYAPAMVTLTYRDGSDWSARHLSEAFKRVRQWLARRGRTFRYVWCAELQERGAIHYHVIAWFPAKFHGTKARKVADTPPFWDAEGWWPHGSSQSAWADNPIGYIASYVSKISGKDRLPAGARMHGSGGFTVDERKYMAHHSRQTWVRVLSYIGQKIQRAQGGGVIQHFACGLRRRIPSPYLVIARGFGRVLIAPRGSSRPDIVQGIETLWHTHTAVPA